MAFRTVRFFQKCNKISTFQKYFRCSYLKMGLAQCKNNSYLRKLHLEKTPFVWNKSLHRLPFYWALWKVFKNVHLHGARLFSLLIVMQEHRTSKISFPHSFSSSFSSSSLNLSAKRFLHSNSPYSLPIFATFQTPKTLSVFYLFIQIFHNILTIFPADRSPLLTLISNRKTQQCILTLNLWKLLPKPPTKHLLTTARDADRTHARRCVQLPKPQGFILL